jgi:hypothetical protein
MQKQHLINSLWMIPLAMFLMGGIWAVIQEWRHDR